VAITEFSIAMLAHPSPLLGAAIADFDDPHDEQPRASCSVGKAQ
jgi:hypothetical protein